MAYGNVSTPGVTLSEMAAAIERQKGAANGLAGLDANGKIQQMPTAVDVGALPVLLVTEVTDFDTLYVAGQIVCYKVKATPGDHAPTKSAWGTLIASDCGTKWQIFIADNGASVYYRTRNGAWTSFLPLTGGTMTGILNSQSHINAGKASLNQTNGLMMHSTYKADTSQGKWWAPLTLPDASGDNSGTAVILQTGGATFVGGGEAGTQLYNALMSAGTITGATEKVWVASDTTIDLVVNCQTIANRKTVSINAAGKVTAPGGFAGDLSAGNITAGTMKGVVAAQNNTAYTTKQVRNVTLSTAAASGGGNGDLFFTYV
ncbi:MAG: hypothetical protein HFJ86_08865 [Oscillospiraceae bacterium]|jgi:hypothetical protein|nr:hypothetical protein [Oscillospiraceae bacterium]